MKKYQIETVKLNKIVGGGQTLGVSPDGKKIFAWGGLPGETVEVEIHKNKKSYAEGVVTNVLAASPRRTQPMDDCYMSTSPWQIMDYEYELELKSQLIREAFELHGIDLAPPAITTDGNQYHYRNKMEYSLWWDHDTETTSLAFHKRGSHQKVSINNSSIERPEILNEAKNIIYDINERKLQARSFQSMVVRCNQAGEVSSALFENGKSHPIMKNLTDTLLGRKFTYSPNGFFQINIPVYGLALTEIKKHISTDSVMDLYAGVGSIGLSVADGKKLVSVESNASAFAELEKNAGPDAKCILAKTEDVLDYITDNATVIVDPPRAGLHDDVVSKLAEIAPPKIIYLSCNPVTQARDIAKLLPQYKITHVQGFNFFPRTPHIESLIVLEK